MEDEDSIEVIEVVTLHKENVREQEDPTQGPPTQEHGEQLDESSDGKNESESENRNENNVETQKDKDSGK